MEKIKTVGQLGQSWWKWTLHINCLEECCHSNIKLLKVLLNHTWGADTKILIKIYQPILRNRLDYR